MKIFLPRRLAAFLTGDTARTSRSIDLFSGSATALTSAGLVTAVTPVSVRIDKYNNQKAIAESSEVYVK